MNTEAMNQSQLICLLVIGLASLTLCKAGPSVCGDGRRDDLEECDDGNVNNNDGCYSNCYMDVNWICNGGTPTAPDRCKPRYCGDGSLQLPEECDDGNGDNGDGCNDVCRLEGFQGCIPPTYNYPSPSTPIVYGSSPPSEIQAFSDLLEQLSSDKAATSGRYLGCWLEQYKQKKIINPCNDLDFVYTTGSTAGYTQEEISNKYREYPMSSYGMHNHRTPIDSFISCGSTASSRQGGPANILTLKITCPAGAGTIGQLGLSTSQTNSKNHNQIHSSHIYLADLIHVHLNHHVWCIFILADMEIFTQFTSLRTLWLVSCKGN
jgi:cysteine-rich repeat protein